MFPYKKGTTPMKKAETQQFVFRIIIAFILLLILMYASIAFSNERVVTVADGNNTWKVIINPQESFSIQAKQSSQRSDTLKAKPVQLAKIVAPPRIAPPPPDLPRNKAPQKANTIPPAPKNIVQPAPQELPAAAPELIVTPMSVAPKTAYPPATSNYKAIYASIPFSRVEYLANPSYRHDATMEIMTGQLRPTVIHKTYQARVLGSSPKPRPRRTRTRRPRRFGYYYYSY